MVQDRVVTQVDRSAGTRRDVAPDPARFPSLLRVFSYVPSPDGLNENLLILLHGLGPYVSWAWACACACVRVRCVRVRVLC